MGTTTCIKEQCIGPGRGAVGSGGGGDGGMREGVEGRGGPVPGAFQRVCLVDGSKTASSWRWAKSESPRSNPEWVAPSCGQTVPPHSSSSGAFQANPCGEKTGARRSGSDQTSS